ncbi:MAG: tail fiber domain-containing protein, partial [Flavobacteriales bacterium]|nr:tail fiber domain-containing protein [Flavobacteriales bacterium]
FRTAPSGTAGNSISYGDRMIIANNGNVGIDILAPLARLDVRKTVGHSNGNGTSNDGPTTAIITSGATARYNDWPNGWGGGLSTWDINCSGIQYTSGTLIARSDFRYKKNIQSLNASELLTRFMELRPVTYYYDTTKLKVDNPDRKIYGFIANEVEKLFPDIVTNAGLPEEVERGMDYTMIIPMLVSVVQKQQQELENLKKVNAEIQNQLNALSRVPNKEFSNNRN